jgi:hypothetical protein
MYVLQRRQLEDEIEVVLDIAAIVSNGSSLN